ncbi:MAG TPA: hypothetical protein VFO01_14420 [Trebonia sp.]|nr:hypothetical protein [Trebonia sp.]
MTASARWDTRSALEAVSVAGDGGVTGYDLSRAPAATQYLGQSMAVIARRFSPTLVLSLADPHDAVLAHIIATEMGIDRSVIYVDLGLLGMSPQPLLPRRVILVGTALGGQPLDPIASLLDRGGHTFVAAIALTSPAGLASRPCAAAGGVATVILDWLAQG